MESNPFGAVGKIDDTAAAKAVLEEQVLHHVVVAVRIDAEVVALAEAPVEAELPHALLLARRGNAVYHAVGAVVQPLASYIFR